MIGNGTLLRYRFGSAAQLHSHLHIVEGRTILFYQDTRVQLGSGERVIVEISFTESEQRTSMRGTVLGRTDGVLPGVWLEFADSRLSRRLASGNIADRKQRRVCCDMLAELRANATQMVRIIDLSQAGARVTGVRGLRVGDEVEVRLVSPEKDWPPELGKATLVRIEGTEAGLHFLRKEPAARMSLTRLSALLQDQWTNAPELNHPPQCCLGGVVIEPAIPRIKSSGRGII